MKKRQKILFNKLSAVAWVVAGLLSIVFKWYDLIFFVTIASVYANVKSDWATAEAVDDRDIVNRLERIEQNQTEILLELRSYKRDSS